MQQQQQQQEAGAEAGGDEATGVSLFGKPVIKKAYKLPSLAAYIPDSTKPRDSGKPKEDKKPKRTTLRATEQPLYVSTPAVIRAGPQIHSPSPSKVTSTASLFISGQSEENVPSSSKSKEVLPVYKTETETTDTIAVVQFRQIPHAAAGGGTMKDEAVGGVPIVEDKITSEPSAEAEHVPTTTEAAASGLPHKLPPQSHVGDKYTESQPPNATEIPKTIDLLQDIAPDKLIDGNEDVEEEEEEEAEPPEHIVTETFIGVIKQQETKKEEKDATEPKNADETEKISDADELVRPHDETDGAKAFVEEVTKDIGKEAEPPVEPPVEVEPVRPVQSALVIETPVQLSSPPLQSPVLVQQQQQSKPSVQAAGLVQAPQPAAEASSTVHGTQPQNAAAPNRADPPRANKTPEKQWESRQVEPPQADPASNEGKQRKVAPPSKLQIKRQVGPFQGFKSKADETNKTEHKFGAAAKTIEAKDHPTSPPSPTARIRNDPGSPKSPTSRVRRLGIQVVDGPLSPNSTRRAAAGTSAGTTDAMKGKSKAEDKQEFGKRFGMTAAKSITAAKKSGKAGTSSQSDASSMRTKKHVSGDSIDDNDDDDDDEPLVFRVRKYDAKSALKALKAVHIPDSPEPQRRERPMSGDGCEFFGGRGTIDRSFYKSREKKERPKSEVIYEGMVSSKKTPLQRAFSMYDQNYRKEPEAVRSSGTSLSKLSKAPEVKPGGRGKRPMSWAGQELRGGKPGSSSSQSSLSSTPHDSTSSISSLRDRFMGSSTDSMSSSKSNLSRESSVSSLRDRFMSPPPTEEPPKSRVRARVVSPPPAGATGGNSRRRSSGGINDIRDRFMSPTPDGACGNESRVKSPDTERLARIRNRFASPTPSEEEVHKEDTNIIKPDPARMASIRNRFMSPPPTTEEAKPKVAGKSGKLKDRLFSPPPPEPAGPSTATKLRQRIFSSSTKTKSATSAASPTSPTLTRDLPDVVSEEKPPDVEEDDFNEGIILPPLIIQLRKILDQYPDDSQILKELIQNAEDAGAKTIKFLYDRHSYGTNTRFLYHPGLAKFQGPSLFAHNDALFDDDDWKGIRMLSQSVKQTDPFKVGYFGLGFKSIFHITDLPSVLSGPRLGMIDPHQRCFPAATHSWNLAKKHDLVNTLPDQFAPFLRVFNCSKEVFSEGHYNGTLFRFPLRTHVSPLSDSLYDKEKVHRLFRSFQSDAHLTLLFLKHLETIELYERDELSVRPRLLFKVQIAEECLEDVRLKRSEFLNKAKSGTWLDKPLMSTYPITIETTRLEGSKEHTKTYRWLITNYYSGGQVSAIFRKLHRDTELSYPPWVGVAMPLNLEADNANLEEEDIYALDDSDGHIFCFLPLPCEKQTPTGLPVHVNGFFALEQNRKYLKWPTSGQGQEELMDKRLLWNQCLLKESIPKAYIELILAAIRLHQTGSNPHLNIATIYRAFPDFKKVDRKWEIILIPLFSELLKHSMVHTAARGGEWVEPRDAIFNTLEEDGDISSVVLKVLAQNDVRVAAVPEHVLHAIKTCCHINLGKITPNLVSTSYRTVQNKCDIEAASYQNEERLSLLRYLLKSRKYELIDGLELLPLANGGFHMFFTNPRRADRGIYMATADHPQILLPGMDDDFIESDIDEDILKSLAKAASRGYTQLKLLSADLVVDLLHKCLPADWRSGTPITWDPQLPDHPPEGWLELLWVYLQKHFRRDLSQYEDLAIVPVGGEAGVREELVPLYCISGIIVRQLDGMSLGDRLEAILNRLGVVVLENLPDYVKSHPMVLEQYVNTPSYIGVLRTLRRITEHVGYNKFLQVFQEVTDDEDKRHLREMFSRMSPFHLQPEHRPILCKLPLFETLEGSGDKPRHFVSEEEVKVGAPSTQLPIHVSRPLLDITGPDSQNLAHLLDIQRMTVIDLLRTVVFPDIEAAYYEPEQIETVMLYVLRHYYSYIEIDESFADTLKSLPFLLRKDMFVTPERLYDPAQQLLQTLFLGEENFPTGPYAEPSIIAILRRIGLKGSSDVETEDLLETAFQIQDSITKDEGDQREAVTKSGALLDYLTKHMNKLNESSEGKELHEHLADIKWVRSLKTKPTFYPNNLFWCEGEHVFAKPCDMRNLKYANICGSVVPVVSSGVSEGLGKVFGWDKPPNLQQVISHLVNVVNSYDSSEKAKYMELATRIYEEMNQHEAENIMRVFERNHLTKWIWHGEGFTETEQIVFKEPFMDLRPFVFSIPTEVSQFRQLFEKCGVKEECSLPEVLMMVRRKYDNVGDHPVSDIKLKRDLHICVSILNEIKANVTEEQLPDLQDLLVLPIHNQKQPRRMRLAPLLDCTFCDQEWMRAGYDLRDLLDEEEEEMLFVHPNVPTATSEALGVPTLMSRMLDAEELDFSFGQTDSLTHRLNVLLQDYTDGFAVPKELVQNADDAGATEVKFLYDERDNKDSMTCLIDESMKECQGPALWVYNDAVFTDDDFENITKLSGATKESHTDKIGRFGLGFNAVYNLTDVPSFISRHNIVIFDPHTTHLGKSIRNKSKPGIKIDMRKHKRKLRRLGNQFKPYNGVFGCDLCPDSNQESYDATLFRFPLRTRSQAVVSEISQKHYDQKEMKTLLQMLIHGADRLLLFTQNVTKITVYHMSKAASDARLPTEVFTVSKKPLKILRELSFQLPLSVATVKQAASQQAFIKQCSVLKACTETMRRIKEGRMSKNAATPTSTMVLQVDCVSTPHCVRLLGGHVSHTSQPWLICSCMGTGESLKMACMEEFLLPTAGVAVPLQYDPQLGMYGPAPILHPENHERPFGNVFTFLPLPIHTGLPIHINGAFAVTSNRRYLCERNEDDKFDVRAIWNEALLSDAVTDSYLQLLDDLTRISEPGMFPFTLLWPRLDTIDTNCKMLAKSFYQLIAQVDASMPAFYSDGSRWVQLNDAVFLDPALRHSAVGDIAMEVFRDCVRGTVTCIIDMPEFARQGFAHAKAEATIVERSYDLARFLKEVMLPNIESIHAAQRDPLILYALRQNDEHIDKLLIETNCIPVSPDGDMLRSPEELVDPAGNLATLYLPQDGRFPYGAETYGSKEILVILKRLGMSSDDMSWDDVIERASSLNELDFHGAKRRVQSLIHFMEKKLEREHRDEVNQYYQRLKDVAFLPIMKRPKTITMQWKGDEFPEEEFLCPQEVYPSEKLPLVCCVEPIVDEAVFPKNSEHVKRFFGFEEKIPDLDLVLLQLDTIVETDFANEDRVVLDEVQKISGVIYEYLQTMLESTESNTVYNTVIERLKDQPFIFSNGLFLKPRQVAFNFPHHCAPYIFGLPEIMGRNYGVLFKKVGMRDTFETKDFVETLQTMHATFTTNSLDKESLKLSLRLVNLLNESLTEAHLPLSEVVELYGSIYIPDSNCVLHDAVDLCYNEPECQWLPQDDDLLLSHPLIPYAMSKQLGVNTRREEVLRKHSKGIPFGQRERLTNRIKRILSSYPCDKEILKELLQNADDAGATELHFVSDGRQHGIERVFDDTWKPLQGPALCVYNNSPFSEMDLEGIQRLGEGSKSADPNKTGQYGVGFNCVYHLTDVPSFLTKSKAIGETLCIFDPHATYIPGATLEEPGRRYEDVEGLRGIFTDVFPCYLEDKFDLSNATMFRFPLRTSAMAQHSELSEQVMNLEKLDNLLVKFKRELFDCLLFVNSVKTISVSEVDKLTNRLTKTYTVTVEITDEDQASRQAFAKFLRDTATRVHNGEMGVWEVPPQEVSYVIKLADNKGYWEKWLVTQRVGYPDGTKISVSLYDGLKRGDLALLPRGGVAALLENSDPSTPFRPMKAFCFLPLPLKTTLPVQINGHFALDHEARRNLWIDDENSPKTEWNMAIIKHIIARAYVSMMRKAPAFLASSQMEAQNTSLFAMEDNEIPNIEFYSNLFPQFKTNEVYWRSVVENVYKIIESTQELVLPVLRTRNLPNLDLSSDDPEGLQDDMSEVEVEWVSTNGDGRGLQRPFFDNLDKTFLDEVDGTNGIMTPRARLKSTPKKKSRRDQLRQVLLASGFKLLHLPLAVYQAFREAGVRAECISPGSVIQFYRSYRTALQACNIGSLPACITNTPFRSTKTLTTVLQYCIQDRETFFTCLDGLPFLLSEDEQLRIFSDQEAPFLTEYYKLLPECSFMFLHHRIVESIFEGVEPEDHHVFQRFDIPALASLLVNVLDERTYRNGHHQLLWKAEEGVLPDAVWIRNLWCFIKSECVRLTNGRDYNDEEMAEQVKIFLKPLRDWCLLPGEIPRLKKNKMSRDKKDQGEADKEELYLVPIGMAETVIDFTQSSIMSYSVRDSLRKMRLPELNSHLLDGTSWSPMPKKNVQNSLNASLNETTTSGGGTSDIVRLLVATLEKPQSVLQVLHYQTKTRATDGLLRQEDCNYILKYFSEYVGDWLEDKLSIAKLRNLPFYLTVHGDLISLNEHIVYALPNDIPTADMQIWEKESGIIFLRSNKNLLGLHEKLACLSLTITEVYTRFIFKNFQLLSPEARIIHLQFLKDGKLQQMDKSEKDLLLVGLRHLEFLSDEVGKLHKANHFYDPYHSVLKVMLGDNPGAFPPPPFNEFKWLDFLRMIGMQHEITKEMFIDFAFNVAQEAAAKPNEMTFNKSRTLLTHLFRRHNLPTEGLLHKIADIKFIPPAKINTMLQKIYPQYGYHASGHLEYISFFDSIPESHEYLVWTSAHLLPNWANPFKLTQNDVSYSYPEDHLLHKFEAYRDEMAKLLGIGQEPPVMSVVHHVRNMCNNANTPDELRSFMKADVMKVVYKYLQRKEAELDDEVKIALSDCPCIIVELGHNMMKPFQVVINMMEEDQIHPYLYKVPTELGEFKNLFLFLGASLNATVDQFTMVLNNIRGETKLLKLHPNELRAAFKAVAGLFHTLEKHPKDPIHSHTLYLPSMSGTLIQAQELVFNDDPSYTDRIKVFDRPFIMDLSECGLSALDYDDLMKLLPKYLQPAMLTSIVHEILEPSSRETVSSFGIAERLKHQLNSKAFSLGISRLIRHEHHRSGHKIQQETLDVIQLKLNNIRVYGVEKVVTYLEYNQKRIAGSETESECFVDKTEGGVIEEDQLWNIYVDTSAAMSEELLVCVAEVVNRIIGGLLRNSVHYLQPILSCPSHAISKVLDRLKIRPDHTIDIKQPTLPTPGSFIPIEDHHLLKEDFEEYEVGEYVGYELEDDDDDADGQLFVYAIIVEKLEEVPEGEEYFFFSQKYKINVGDAHTPVIASVTDLYKFHRVEGFVSRNTSFMDDSFEGGESPNQSYGDPFSPRESRTYSNEANKERQRYDPYNRSGHRQNGTDSNSSRQEQQQSHRENDFSSRFNRSKGYNDPSHRQNTSHENMNGYREHYQQQQEDNSTKPPPHADTGYKSKQRSRNNFNKTRQDSTGSEFDFSEYCRFFPTRGERSRSQARSQSQAQDHGSQPKSEPTTGPQFHPFRGQHEQHSDTSTPGPAPEGESYREKYSRREAAANAAKQERAAHSAGTESSPPGGGTNTDGWNQEPPPSQESETQDEPDGEPDEDEVNMKAIMDEISDALEEAWQLPTEKERKKVIKRLLLKWHPDKNIGNEVFATTITQFIQSEIERLEQGLPRKVYVDPSNFTQGNPFTSSQNFQRNFEEAYKFFYEQMNQRGKQHRKQRERYKENFSREYTSTKTDYNFDVPPTFSSTNPQPSAAKSFFKQAQADLRSADNDILGLRAGPAFDWVCFKAHQAAEKALKAAQFSVDAISSYSHDLPTLAAATDDMRLRLHAKNLQRIVGDAGKLYNPDPIDFMNIPEDRYTMDSAEAAVELAAKILDRVKDFMELTD